MRDIGSLPDELRELALRDATVHHYVHYWEYGEVTYEHMPEKLVVHLATDKSRLLDHNIELCKKSMMSHITVGLINPEGNKHA